MPEPEALVRALREGSYGAGELVQTLGTGILADIPAGLAGLLALGATRDPDKAAEAVRKLQQRFTYAPRTDVGQRGAENLGYPFKRAGELLMETPVGRGWEQFATGHPAAGAATLAAGSMIGGPLKPKKPKVAVQNVFENVTDPQAALAMAKRGEHLKVDPKTGKYIGAPQSMTSPSALGAMRTRLREATEEGMWNADWYERQRALARAVAPDDPTGQSLFARGTAAYSPQAMPKVELPAFLRQYNEQMLSGEMAAPRTGPQARNVAQAFEYDPLTASYTFSPEAIRLGPKTKPYAQAKDPTVAPETLFKAPTDIWHARAAGYEQPGKEKFSRGLKPAETAFMTGENLILGERTGLLPKEAQAATWGTVRFEDLQAEDAARFAKQSKARERYERDPAKWRERNEGKSPPPKPAALMTETQLRDRAKEGLDTAAAPRQSFYLTQEAIPGFEAGHLRGIQDAPEAVKQQYTADILRKTGRDPLLAGLQLYGGEPVQGLRGQWTRPSGEVEFNPSWTDPTLVSNVGSTAKGGIRTPEIEQEALGLAAQTGALMRGQAAGAGQRFVPEAMSPKVGTMNAMRFQNLSPEAQAQLRAAGLDVNQMTPETFHATRFGEEGPIPGTQREIAQLLPGEGERGTLETVYAPGLPTEVGTGRATEALIGRIEGSPIRDVAQRMPGWQQTARAYNEIDRALAAERSLPLREDLMKLREIVGQGGIPGLIDYVKQHGAKGLPVALLGALGLQGLAEVEGAPAD